GYGTRSALIGVNVREGNARVVVDGDEDVLPSDVPGPLAVVARDSMTDILEASELLDVDVQQLTRCLALVALDSLLGPQIAQLGQASTSQHAAHGRLGDAHVRSEASLQE